MKIIEKCVSIKKEVSCSHLAQSSIYKPAFREETDLLSARKGE